ncbi:MAG: GUN4 domain-containing protein, partial [Microcystis sp.]
LLAAGKWKEADEETGKIMYQCVGRERQEWLDAETINTFPCEDLRTINQLWLHYSNGKFGFSVQKEIYESLGGTREYNEEVWKKFGDRVGWRKGGSWLYSSDLTYSDEAPKAHLPNTLFIGWRWWYEEMVKKGISFSRAKACNL